MKNSKMYRSRKNSVVNPVYPLPSFNSDQLVEILFDVYPLKSSPIIIIFNNSFIEMQFTYHIAHPFKVYSSLIFNIFTDLCNYNH